MRAFLVLLAAATLLAPVASAATLVFDAGGSSPRCYLHADPPSPPEFWVENNGDETNGEGPGLQRDGDPGPDGEPGTADDGPPDARFTDAPAWARFCAPGP